MKTRMMKLVFILSVFLLFAPVVAYTSPIVYTTEASWLAAIGSAVVTTEDFESSSTGALATGTTDIGLFDVTITSNAEGQIGIFSSGIVNGTKEFQGDIDNDSTLSMDFSNFDVPSLIGFAGNWASTTSGDLLTMTINGTTIQFDNYLTSGGGLGFLGIVDTVGFSSLTFGTENPSSFGEFFALDNVKIASAVPEPSTMLLFGAGLAGLAGFSRRHKGK